MTPSAAGFPLPHQPPWTDKKELKTLGAIREQETTELGSRGSYASSCVACCPEALKTPVAYARSLGISRGHPACQSYPRATDLAAHQEPWNQAWSLSEPIPCLCRKSLKLMLLQNILVSMNLPFHMESYFVRKFPASSRLQIPWAG